MKQNQITVRVATELYEQLERAARLTGRRTSELVREYISGQVGETIAEAARRGPDDPGQLELHREVRQMYNAFRRGENRTIALEDLQGSLGQALLRLLRTYHEGEPLPRLPQDEVAEELLAELGAKVQPFRAGLLELVERGELGITREGEAVAFVPTFRLRVAADAGNADDYPANAFVLLVLAGLVSGVEGKDGRYYVWGGGKGGRPRGRR